jgi:hypothetical protein
VAFIEDITSDGLSLTSNSSFLSYFSFLKGNTDCFVAYFDLLKRALRSAARPVVLEHLRPLFKVFLEAFDEFKVRTDEVNGSL